MAGKHEKPDSRATVTEHHFAHHLGEAVGDWLTAEWTEPVSHATRVDNEAMVIIVESLSRSFVEGESETELWCIDHCIEVSAGALELDYA